MPRGVLVPIVRNVPRATLHRVVWSSLFGIARRYRMASSRCLLRSSAEQHNCEGLCGRSRRSHQRTYASRCYLIHASKQTASTKSISASKRYFKIGHRRPVQGTTRYLPSATPSMWALGARREQRIPRSIPRAGTARHNSKEAQIPELSQPRSAPISREETKSRSRTTKFKA